MKPFHESLRYEYPLTPSSYVIDAGAYYGNWSAEISRRYGCHIDAYEPIFYKEAKATLAPFKHVSLYEFGLTATSRTTQFGIQGDMTGEFNHSLEQANVQLVGIEDRLAAPIVDLLKLNIEGGEYLLLQHLIERGLARRFRNIQVQFHSNIPEALYNWISIFEHLLTTHDVTYMKPFCWENYQLRQ